MIMLLYLSRRGVMLDFDSSLFLLSSMTIYLKIGIYENVTTIFGYCFSFFALAVWGKHGLKTEDINNSKSEGI